MTNATKTTVQNFWPEMGQAKPAANCEIRSGFDKMTIWTRQTFPTKRGIKLVRVLASSDLVPQSQHRIGTNEYSVTAAALEVLKADGRFTFSRECLLD